VTPGLRLGLRSDRPCGAETLPQWASQVPTRRENWGALSAALLALWCGVVGAQDPAPATPNATELLATAHQRLLSHSHIRAELHEVVAIKHPPFRMSGSYVSAGLKLRLNLNVKLPGGVQGALLEVCDGERLWSVTELPGSTRVTRRDVRQLLAAMDQAKGRPDRAAAIDLALGGLPALLTSLSRTMQFQSVKAETRSDREFWMVSGKWRAEFLRQLTGSDDKTPLPTHIPDAVRVYLAQDTLFPEQIVYLKQLSDGEGYRPLLELKLTNVVLNGPVDSREFEFTPPANVEPEDVTRQYIEQLFPSPPTTKPSSGEPAK
jgi:hypothetical protein